LVEHEPWALVVAGSNPASPTTVQARRSRVSPLPMTREQTDDLARQLEAASDLARTLCREFSTLELSTPPPAGGWSAADNLAHLTLASQALVPRMSRTLRKLGETGRRSDRPSRPDWFGRLYAWALEPPVRLRVRAPRPFVPLVGTPAAEALSAFLAEQQRVLALVEQSVGLDLEARKVPSPVSRAIRYNVCSSFHILVAHQRRHLWQARRAAIAVRGHGDEAARP
jgi:hypothetical protein